MSVSLARKSEMALSEAERQPNADADGEEGMLSEIVSSSNVVDGVNVSMGRGNVEGVSDISPEKSKEIKVSEKPDVPIQVLVDDSRFPDVVMKQENLERNSPDSSMRNENVPQRVSGGGDELNAKRVESGGSHFDSKISMFDEFSASGPSISSLGTVPSSVGHRYEVGDLVWGKVKSHPWWPGHIYNDMFASPAVRRNKRPGYFLVAFFGDSSYGWFASDELVPFEPNFEEKSQQTNSRNFVKAVSEAVEEISRRCAMGLSCKCRNTYKFHPTKVQGFVAVEVNQYDGGIYSMKQIEKARNLFQPQQILDHIKIAAQMPLDVDYHDINVIQRNATTSAYRKSVFEEFDETYAQAFGQNPIHHPPISLETTTQAAREPRAPLSGPLVIPDAMGKKKISAKLNKSKETNKDKYLLKRRVEPSEPNQQMQNSVLPPLSIERVSSIQTPVQKPSSSERDKTTDSKLKAKKAKVFKRPHSEINVEKKSVQMGEMKMKKKQKKMEIGSEPKKSEVVFPKIMQDASASGTQNLKLPELVRSLEALAKDPFYNSGIYSPKTVKDAFLRYRSQVYQKSSQVYQKTLADPSPSQSETDTSLNQRPMQPLISRPDTSSNQQPIQPLISRPDDPTRGGRKREASDRQEESSSKRLKKVNNLKTAITRPPPAKPAERPPRVREPTALVIKFPSNFSLPSSSELKARLARFGPLDQFGTRIFYKTHTCRVVFLFKSDAMAANKHLLGTSRLFGNVQVMCHIRDMSAQMLESEPNKAVTEDTPSIEPPPQQLKSCLKKPPSAADETTTTGEVPKGKSRVKFLLGGEETSHVNIPNRKLAINGTISSSTFSSSGDFDFDSNTTTTTTTFINKPVSVSMLPPAASYTFPTTTTHSPTVSPFPIAPLFQNMQVNVVDNVSGSSKVDIAPQMLGLLARCSDVVAMIRNHFGYIPYHSL